MYCDFKRSFFIKKEGVCKLYFVHVITKQSVYICVIISYKRGFENKVVEKKTYTPIVPNANWNDNLPPNISKIFFVAKGLIVF